MSNKALHKEYRSAGDGYLSKRASEPELVEPVKAASSRVAAPTMNPRDSSRLFTDSSPTGTSCNTLRYL